MTAQRILERTTICIWGSDPVDLHSNHTAKRGTMRTTKKHLEGSLQVLNEMLGRPLQHYADGEYFSGNITYEHWGNSYFITETEGSGGRRLSDSGTLREAHAWVCAAIKGVQLSRDQNVGF